MSEERDTTEQPSEVEKQTIREVIAGRNERLRLEHWEAERVSRKKARTEREHARRKARDDQARQDQAQRWKESQEATERAGEHVRQASRALRSAIRDLQSVSLPRHSPEGRGQLRTMRSLEAALGALRSFGRGGLYGESLDGEVDLDAVL